ncbi:MAG: 50S ribosomal protein L24 [Thermodesulfovibrionia bacterium]
MGLGIRKNDTVMVIAGDEKGKRGRVLAVNPKKERIIVEGINIVKRHMRPSAKYRQGGIIDKEAPIHRSNLMLVCPKCDKPTRIGHILLEDGRKMRRCKECGEVIE